MPFRGGPVETILVLPAGAEATGVESSDVEDAKVAAGAEPGDGAVASLPAAGADRAPEAALAPDAVDLFRIPAALSLVV